MKAIRVAMARHPILLELGSEVYAMSTRSPIRKAPFAVPVDDIRWDRLHPDGTRSTTLCGSRDAGRSFA
jgi:hypothetical protein